MSLTHGDPDGDSAVLTPQFAPRLSAADNPTMQSEDRQRLLGDDDKDVTKRRIKYPTRCGGCTVIVEPMLFLFMLAEFPMFILLPQYLERREWEMRMGNTTFPSDTNSCIPHIHGPNDSDISDPISGNLTLATSAASLMGLQTSLASSIPAILPVLFLGPYSDAVGRKYAIIPPIIGQTISMLNLLLNTYFKLPLELLLIGSFIYGCCGYWVCIFMGCISFITDITPIEKRSFRIIIAEICVFAPTILSAAGSGFWIEKLGFPLVFLIILICDIFILLYAIFFIPETIEKDPNAKFFTLKYIEKAFTIFVVDNGTNRRWKLNVLLTTLFVYLSMNFGSVDTYFVMNLPLCWGAITIGIYLAINIGVSVLGSAFFAKTLGLCLRDAWMTVMAILTNVAQNIYKYFVVSTPMMLTSAAFNCMGVVSTPTIRSMISKLVQPDEVGAAFSGIAVVEVLCGVVGSVLLNPIYSATAKNGQPSAVFLVIASAYIVAFILMVTYSILTRNDNKKNQPVLISDTDVCNAEQVHS